MDIKNLAYTYSVKTGVLLCNFKTQYLHRSWLFLVDNQTYNNHGSNSLFGFQKYQKIVSNEIKSCKFVNLNKPEIKSDVLPKDVILILDIYGSMDYGNYEG